MARSGAFSSTGGLGFAGRSAGSLMGDYTLLPDGTQQPLDPAFTDESPASGYNPDAYEPEIYGDPVYGSMMRALSAEQDIYQAVRKRIATEHPDWRWDQVAAAAMVDDELYKWRDETLRDTGWYPDPRNPGTYITPENYEAQTGRKLTFQYTDTYRLTPQSTDAEMNQWMQDLMAQKQASKAAGGTGGGGGGGGQGTAANVGKGTSPGVLDRADITALDRYIANLRGKKSATPADVAKLREYEKRRADYLTRLAGAETEAPAPPPTPEGEGKDTQARDAAREALLSRRQQALPALDRYIANLRSIKAPTAAQTAKLREYEKRKREYGPTPPPGAPPPTGPTKENDGRAGAGGTGGTGGAAKDYSGEISKLDRYIKNLAGSKDIGDIAKLRQYEARRREYASR